MPNDIPIPAKLNFFVHRQTFDGWKILPRSLPDYELVLLLKGQGHITVCGEHFPVNAGDLICFKPGIEHSLWVEQEPYMLFYGLHFMPSDPAQPVPFPDLLHLDAPARLEKIFHTLHETYYSKPYLFEWKQALLLQQILCEILSILHEKEEPAGSRRIRQVLEYIHEDPCRPITLEGLLRQVGIQKTEFIRIFRTVTGTTPIRYIIDRRLENACELLETTELPVALIAERCGFSDAFYFSRCFSAHYAVSPREYRKQHGGRQI